SGAAQIREQQKALIEILRLNLGNVNPGFGEDTRDVHELPAVLTVGRRVHRDERRLRLPAAYPEIASEARIVGGRRDAEVAAAERRLQPLAQLPGSVQKSS